MPSPNASTQRAPGDKKKKKNDLLFPISSGRACGVSAVRRACTCMYGVVCKVVTICAYSTWYYHSIDSGERVRHVCLDSACRYSVHLHADVCKAACGPGQWAPPLRLSLCVSLTMLLLFFFLVFADAALPYVVEPLRKCMRADNSFSLSCNYSTTSSSPSLCVVFPLDRDFPQYRTCMRVRLLSKATQNAAAPHRRQRYCTYCERETHGLLVVSCYCTVPAAWISYVRVRRGTDGSSLSPVMGTEYVTC